jgi:tetratricopeptide (TPR) repeat protein
VTIISPSPAPSSPASALHPIFSSIGATVFHEGDVLGGRYEILKMLGMGGMGAVYEARDMEVERIVALKVIRPDLAGNPAILARFKQELVLARQVTHKNIVRIFDLHSEADGAKYITMEFIAGEDLRTMLTRLGKLPPEEAVDVMLQVCAGLNAAHAEGVIHRDLKPSNIMRDPSGRVVLMDFGLARTIEGDGMTQTGMMIGTMEYMSPEQAMGKDLDARSDEFALGLIFYELLTGFMPYHAESAIASLVKRTQERAVPLADVDTAIPDELSAIVGKCLERDPAERFASIEELVGALEVWQGKKAPSGPSLSQRARAIPPAPARGLPAKWIAVAVAAIVLVAGVVEGIRYATHPGPAKSAVQGPVTSLAIVPLYNASGDASLNWMGASIAETLSTDMGESAHLRMVSADRLQQVLQDLRVSSQSQLDLSTLRRIAEYTHADTIVYGQYERFGDQTRITTTLHDLKNDREISVKSEVTNGKDLLASLDKLADELRAKVATTPQILKELEAHSQHVPTKSLEALRAYDEGLQLARSGNNIQAMAKFEQATTQDPSFAMAFSRLAQTYAAAGYDDKAEQVSRRSVELSDNLPERDRFLIQANHAGILHDNSKAIAAYAQLAKVNPDDTDVQFALARLYEDSNNFDQAKKRLVKVLAADPNYVAALLASGRVDIKSGDSQAALDPLNKALSLAIQFDNQEEKGSALQALGIAYQRLNRTEDALQNYQQALGIRRKLGDQHGIANSLLQIGQIQDAKGDSKAALSSYQEAVQVDRNIGDKSGLTQNLMTLGAFYLDHGQYDDGLKYTKQALQVARDTGDEMAQATLLMNIGAAHFSRGEYQDALTYFQQAYDIRSRLNQDATTELHDLAETNVSLGQYDTALSQYLQALDAQRAKGDKSGIATESADMGALFAVQGRYDAALKAQQEAVNIYQQLGDRTYQMVLALAEYGRTLSAVSRQDEGRNDINAALKLAPDAKNDAATAVAWNAMGDSYFYAGDFASARQQYDKALQIATKGNVKEQAVIAKLNLAKTDVAQGHAQAAISTLRKLQQEADFMGLKADAVMAQIYLGQALVSTHHAAEARQVLDSAVGSAEKLGLRVEQARAQYFLGAALASSGQAKDAVPHYREAVKILESISREEGAGRVLDRADLKDIYRNAAKGYQG